MSIEKCVIDNIKEQMKEKKEKNSTLEKKTYIVYNSLKALPSLVNKELKNTKKHPTEVYYNDVWEVLNNLQDEQFITKINNDKDSYVKIYEDYYSTHYEDEEDEDDFENIEDLQNKEHFSKINTFIKEQKKQLKKDLKEDNVNEFKEIFDKAEALKNKYHPFFHNVFRLNNNHIRLNTHPKQLIKINSFNDLKRIYTNSGYTFVINTLAKDFKPDEIKEIVDYALTFKKVWIICDCITYKLIGVEGIEIKKNKEFLIKF